MATSKITTKKNILKNKLYPESTEINEKGHLTIGGYDTVELVKKFGTPLYVVDELTVRAKANEYVTALKKYYNNFLVLYAAKAFACTGIFKLVDNLGLGIDVVSGGEIYLALKTKTNKNNIYFNGNNKSEEELNMAIKNEIENIIIDNFYELELTNKIAKEMNKKVKILIRLTPGIECHTHEYIKTGHLDSKFGFDTDYFEEVINLITQKFDSLHLTGIHAHIGSQIFELKPFADTVDVVFEYFKIAKQKYNIELSELDIGGGIGISYTSKDDPPSIEDWVKTTSEAINKNCNKLNLIPPKLICEPGRSLIGTSGITLYKAGSTKQVPNGRKFVSVDGGMADNPRPITYQAEYTAVVANKMNKSTNHEPVTIAGRYCETGDILVKDILLPKIEPDDIIAVLGTGAYNYSMSSNYNTVPRPACVLVNNGKADILIDREDYNSITSKHRIPEWLN